MPLTGVSWNCSSDGRPCVTLASSVCFRLSFVTVTLYRPDCKSDLQELALTVRLRLRLPARFDGLDGDDGALDGLAHGVDDLASDDALGEGGGGNRQHDGEREDAADQMWSA